jgi:hypothetical protein
MPVVLKTPENYRATSKRLTKQIEARFRRFGLNDDWFNLSGNDLEKIKGLVDYTVVTAAGQPIEPTGFAQLAAKIRAIEPENPDGN